VNAEFWATIRDIGAVSVAIVAISGLSITVIKFGIIKPIKLYIDKATIQLTPNSGSHLADAINRTDEKVDSLVKGQDKLLDIMMKHLQDHSVSTKVVK
jgi:hypothetical protein